MRHSHVARTSTKRDDVAASNDPRVAGNANDHPLERHVEEVATISPAAGPAHQLVDVAVGARKWVYRYLALTDTSSSLGTPAARSSAAASSTSSTRKPTVRLSPPAAPVPSEGPIAKVEPSGRAKKSCGVDVARLDDDGRLLDVRGFFGSSGA